MRRRPALAAHVALVLSALIVMVPFVWVIGAGFRTQISLLMGEVWFSPTLASFNDVLFSRASDFVLNFQNSLIIGVSSTVLCLTIATLAAWSLGRLHWPRSVVVLFLGWSLLFHMLPPVMLAGAWYSMVRAVHLENTHAAIILAHTTLNLPMALWLMGVFVREVPQELLDAANIDGASPWMALWKIARPIFAPGLAATAIMIFIFSWNEFAVALVLAVKQTATVPVGIAKYAQGYEIQYTQMAASAALSIIPAVILLILGQRAIVSGLTSGALK